MLDWAKEFDYAKVMIWVVPGLLFVLFRSFAIRGAFPAVTKDDIAAFLLASVLYNFFISAAVFRAALNPIGWSQGWSFLLWLVVLCALPVIAGFLIGLFEVSDVTGRLLRRMGVVFPSPTPTAWETLFKELKRGSVLIVTLKDGTVVYGRWIGGTRLSSASTDPSIMDLFIAEIGTLDCQDRYIPKSPQRGIYVPASELRSIEVV